MSEILHTHIQEIEGKHKAAHEGYEYIQRTFLPRGFAKQCVVSIYEVPPGKSAYPYHYHLKNEEVFYILQGSGILKTPAGDKTVRAGELLFFPASEAGAHKLTNASDTETLVYLDFDTENDLEVSFYPDSGKIGVWGKDTNRLFKTSDAVDYYDGE